MNKVCKKCNLLKSNDDYYDNPGKKDGKSNVCKVCTRTAAIKNHQQPGKKEKRREQYLARKEMNSNKSDSPIKFASQKQRQKHFNKLYPPIDLRFNEIDFNRVHDVMTKEGIKSFSGAFKHILKASLKKSRHFTPNAFSNSLSIMDSNRYQLLRLKNNLDQLLDGYYNGKAPGIHAHIDQLKSLIASASDQIELIMKTTVQITDKQP